MDDFETPYEDDEVNEFITCTICEKSIKGSTLYKIHVTTSSHLKKEDDLVARGLMSREKRVPIFNDILQYLDYLQLNEPIIGLSVLQQITLCKADKSVWPIYNCLLCKQNLNLPEMVNHLIGRKHRQKYMESNWPDMVPLDLDTNSGAKLLRSKAEMIEKEEGRGCPKPMKNERNVKKSQNLPTVPQRQNLQGNAWFPKFDAAPVQRDDHFQQGRNIKNRSFDPDEARGFNGEKQKYQREDEPGYSVQESGWVNERETDRARQFSDSNFQYIDKLVRDPQSPVDRKPVLPRYTLNEEPPRGHAFYEQHSPDAPYPERHREFYSDNSKHERDYHPSDFKAPMRYGDEEKQWSPAAVYTTREEEWREANKPAPKSSFTTDVTSSKPHDRILVKDYYHQLSVTTANERFENIGSSRASTFPSSVDMKRTISSIPEPFMRFLEQAEDHEGNRKRTSRFSDATAEEVATAKKVFRGEYSSMFDRTLVSEQSPNQAELRPVYSSMLSGGSRTERGPNQAEYPSILSGPFRTEKGSIQAEFSTEYSSKLDGPSRRESGSSQAEFQPEYSSTLDGPSRRESGSSQAEFRPRYSPMFDGPSRRERCPIDAEYRPESSSMLACPPRPERGSLMAESRTRPHPMYQKESEDFPPGNRQRERSDPEYVLDMLDHVEIENVDDAKFLKNKLLNILDEYKAKKNNQNNRGRNEEYSNPGSRRSPERPYEGGIRGDGDMRRSNDLDFREGHVRSGWRDDDYGGPARGRPDYRQPMPKENILSRGAYEEVLGPANMYPDEPRHVPNRLPEHMMPRNHRSIPNERFDCSAGPSRDPDPTMPRRLQYSSNIEKLNSTLMALIRRK